jgi:hypothetical protein
MVRCKGATVTDGLFFLKGNPMNGSRHRVLFLFAVVFLVLGVAQFAAAESVIDYTNCTVIASSEGGAREAGRAINASGLDPVEGDHGATHDGGFNPNYQAWHTIYNGADNGIVEHGWFIVDLGGSYAVESINIWNYNHEGGAGDSETPAGELARGVKDFNLWVRNDGTAGGNVHNSNVIFDSNGWTQIGGANVLQPGTGLDDYIGESFALGGDATHVAIEILSNHDGTVTANGTLQDNFGPLVGLSEVRVFADVVPEPGALVLLMVLGFTGLLRRVR